jgi:hypothetical protein
MRRGRTVPRIPQRGSGAPRGLRRIRYPSPPELIHLMKHQNKQQLTAHCSECCCYTVRFRVKFSKQYRIF